MVAKNHMVMWLFTRSYSEKITYAYTIYTNWVTNYVERVGEKERLMDMSTETIKFKYYIISGIKNGIVCIYTNQYTIPNSCSCVRVFNRKCS